MHDLRSKVCGSTGPAFYDSCAAGARRRNIRVVVGRRLRIALFLATTGSVAANRAFQYFL
jgi:hypothetical protein